MGRNTNRHLRNRRKGQKIAKKLRQQAKQRSKPQQAGGRN